MIGPIRYCFKEKVSAYMHLLFELGFIGLIQIYINYIMSPSVNRFLFARQFLIDLLNLPALLTNEVFNSLNLLDHQMYLSEKSMFNFDPEMFIDCWKQFARLGFISYRKLRISIVIYCDAI